MPRNPYGPSTSDNLAALFLGLQGLGEGMRQYGEQKNRKLERKVTLMNTLTNAPPEKRKAILSNFTPKELKQLGIKQDIDVQLTPEEELSRGQAGSGLTLLPLQTRATAHQLETGMRQGDLNTERLQQMVKAGQIDLDDAETKRVMKAHPNRILAMALGEGRSFAEAVGLANAEADPTGVLGEARAGMETTPEGQKRKRGEYYTMLTTNPQIAMGSKQALELSDSLAKGDFKAIEKIPDKKLRTAAQISLADQLERTNLQKKSMAQDEERAIGTATFGLMQQYAGELDPDQARRIVSATFRGEDLEGEDAEVMGKVKNQLNELRKLQIIQKQQEISNDPTKVKMLQDLYQDMLNKAKIKGQYVDAKTLKAVEAKYIEEVAKRTGLSLEVAESSSFWKDSILGIGRLAQGVGQDAAAGPDAQSQAKVFMDDLLGPDITKLVENSVTGVGALAKTAAGIPLKGAELIGKAATIGAPPPINQMIYGEEGHPWITQAEARLPGFKALLKGRLDEKVANLVQMSDQAGNLTEPQKKTMLEQLKYYESLLKTIGEK